MSRPRPLPAPVTTAARPEFFDGSDIGELLSLEDEFRLRLRRAQAPGAVFPSVLQCDLHAVSGQLEFQADLRGNELDNDAVLILEVHGCAASRNGDTGAGCDVISGEIRDTLQVID